jgi:hypothetical protein
VKNGIPFDVAESWPQNERDAYYIIFSEMNGGVFDWEAMRFMAPS